MSEFAFMCRYRSSFAMLAAAVPAAVAWALITWRVGFGKSFADLADYGLPALPELPLTLVWTAFVVFGIAVPFALWNRIAVVETRAGEIVVRPQWGATFRLVPRDVTEVEQEREVVKIRLGKRRRLRFGTGRAAELAAVFGAEKTTSR